MEPTGVLHGHVTSCVGHLLRQHVLTHGTGVVVGAGTGFVLARGPDTVRAPCSGSRKRLARRRPRRSAAPSGRSGGRPAPREAAPGYGSSRCGRSCRPERSASMVPCAAPSKGYGLVAGPVDAGVRSPSAGRCASSLRGRLPVALLGHGPLTSRWPARSTAVVRSSAAGSCHLAPAMSPRVCLHELSASAIGWPSGSGRGANADRARLGVGTISVGRVATGRPGPATGPGVTHERAAAGCLRAPRRSADVATRSSPCGRCRQPERPSGITPPRSPRIGRSPPCGWPRPPCAGCA